MAALTIRLLADDDLIYTPSVGGYADLVREQLADVATDDDGWDDAMQTAGAAADDDLTTLDGASTKLATVNATAQGGGAALAQPVTSETAQFPASATALNADTTGS